MEEPRDISPHPRTVRHCRGENCCMVMCCWLIVMFSPFNGVSFVFNETKIVGKTKYRNQHYLDMT